MGAKPAFDKLGRRSSAAEAQPPLPERVEGNGSFDGFDGFDKLSRRSSAAEAQPPKLSRRKPTHRCLSL
ncbi:MAG: hypothetical protein ACUVRU_12245, partial [Anaerolineae bacterium]